MGFEIMLQNLPELTADLMDVNGGGAAAASGPAAPVVVLWWDKNLVPAPAAALSRWQVGITKALLVLMSKR